LSFSAATKVALTLSVSVLTEPVKPLFDAVKVPMVAMVFSPFCCRAATVAASMAVLGPGSDRPAAVRPAAARRTA